MTDYSTRFGLLPVSDAQIWHCVAPLPGFAELQRFALLHVQEQGPFLWLQSLEEPLIAFLLVAPEHFGLRYPQRPHFAAQETDGTSMVMVILPQKANEALQANALAPLYFLPGPRRFGQWIVEHAEPNPAHVSTAKTPPATLNAPLIHLGLSRQSAVASALAMGAA